MAVRAAHRARWTRLNGRRITKRYSARNKRAQDRAMRKNLSQAEIAEIVELREVYLLEWPEVQKRTGIEAQTCAKRYRAERGEELNRVYKSQVMRRLKTDRLTGVKPDVEFEGANWVPQLRLITGASTWQHQ